MRFRQYCFLQKYDPEDMFPDFLRDLAYYWVQGDDACAFVRCVCKQLMYQKYCSNKKINKYVFM